MEMFLRDIRYGIRLFFRNPAPMAVAVLTLALGIGANTAIFSVVNGVLLQPLPYDQPEELVMVWQDHTRLDGPATEWASPDNFFDWRDQNEVFEGIFALSGWGPTLSGRDEPELLAGAQVSHDAFSVLGVEPILGRGFRPEEDVASGDFVVILGHSLWQRRFGGTPDVLGTAITLDGEPATVVGVLPPSFDFPVVQNAEVFTTLRIDRTNSCGRGCVTLRTIARLKEGTTLDTARAEMGGIAARLERDYPDDNTGIGVNVVLLHEQIVGPLRTALWMLLGAVGFVLLIACANVANLILVRAADREKEVATRIAIGAGRGRLMRQMMTESFLLAFIGAGLGLVLALWGVDLLLTLVLDRLPRFTEVSIDGKVLGFTMAVAVLTGLVFGLVPALRASGTNLTGSLKEGSRGAGGSSRFRGLLVIAEVALALTLLVGAGLLMRSFANLIAVDPGFDADNLLTAQLNLVGTRYEEAEPRVAFVEGLLERVQALPGVEDAGIIYTLPLAGNDADAGFLIEGRERPRPSETPVAWYRPASPDYFSTMRMKLARGRWFREGDDAGAAPVVLINETSARRYWPDEDPIGARVRIGGAWRQVVGVVADTKHFGLDQAPRPAMYFPYKQLPQRFMSLVARTSGDPSLLAGSVRGAVWGLDPGLAVSSVTTMRDIISETVAAPRVTTVLLSVFAVSAVVLAAIGLYGVMSASVQQRTHEIGIRVALGARAGQVLWWVVGRGMLLMAIGAAIGLTAAFVLSRLMESLLFGISAADTITFVGGPIVLAAVTLVACYIPARRAARVDPVVALRYE